MAERVELPPYARIAAELRRRIDAGELRPGERIPSTRQLTRDWGVALATAAKALAVLAQEGLTQSRPRVGTVVATGAGNGPAPKATSGAPTRPTGIADIVTTAIAIADHDGIAALSMRGLAARLGMPTMSLYSHVRSKEALVELMIDKAFGEQELPARVPADRRSGLEVSARMQWATYRAHPWLAHVVSLTRPAPLHNHLRLAEWAFQVLDGTGLDQTTLFDIHMTICTYVRGVAIGIVPEVEAEADTGLTGDEWAEAATELNTMISTGPYPALREVASRGNYVLDLDRLFEFGLRRLLDGMAPPPPADFAGPLYASHEPRLVRGEQEFCEVPLRG